MNFRTTALALALLAAGPGAAAQDAGVAIQNVLLRNSFKPFGSGARGLGMGGAFIAVADDGTASSFNPAGLTQLRSSELAIVGFGNEVRSTITNPQIQPNGTVLSQVREEKSRHSSPDFVGLAVPFEVGSRTMTIQLSYQRAVDLFGEGQTDAVSVDPAQNLFTSAELNRLRLQPTDAVLTAANVVPKQRGSLDTASLAAAYQLTSRLSLGAAANYWRGRWSAEGQVTSLLQKINTREGQVPQPSTRLLEIRESFREQNNLHGLNVNLGFLLKYSRASLGGVVRFPFGGDYYLDEEVQETETIYVAPQAADTFDEGGVVTTRMHWPLSAGLGLAIRPFRGLTLSGEVSSFRWSRASIDAVPSGALLTPHAADGEPTTYTDRSFFDLLPAQQTRTQDTFQWRAGGEYLVSLPKVVVPLRGGYLRDESPVVDLGEGGEGRRIRGWTAGTGLNFSRVVIDLAFERRETEGIIGLGRPTINRPGQATISARDLTPSETVRDDRVVASVIFRPAPGHDPLKKLFRFLFVSGEDERDGEEKAE